MWNTNSCLEEIKKWMVENMSNVLLKKINEMERFFREYDGKALVNESFAQKAVKGMLQPPIMNFINAGPKYRKLYDLSDKCNDDFLLKLSDLLAYNNSEISEENKLTISVAMFNMCACYNLSKDDCFKIIPNIISEENKIFLQDMIHFIYGQLHRKEGSWKDILNNKIINKYSGIREHHIISLYKFNAYVADFLENDNDTFSRVKAQRCLRRMNGEHKDIAMARGLDFSYINLIYLPQLCSLGMFRVNSDRTYQRNGNFDIGERQQFLHLRIEVKSYDTDISKLLEKMFSNDVQGLKLEAYEILEFWRKKQNEIDDLKPYTTIYSCVKKIDKYKNNEQIAYETQKERERLAEDLEHLILLQCADKEELAYSYFNIVKTLYAPFEQSYEYNVSDEYKFELKIYKIMKEIRNITQHSGDILLRRIDDERLFLLLFSIGMRITFENINRPEETIEVEQELIEAYEENYNSVSNYEKIRERLLCTWYNEFIGYLKEPKIQSVDNIISEYKNLLMKDKGTSEIIKYKKKKIRDSGYTYEGMMKFLCIVFMCCQINGLSFDSERNYIRGKFMVSNNIDTKNKYIKLSLSALLNAFMKSKLNNEDGCVTSFTLYL